MGENTAFKSDLFYDSLETETDILSTNTKLETLVSDLIEETYLEAKRLVMQRTKAIDKVTSLILLDPVNTIDGRALIESINSEPITDIDPQLEKQVEDQRKTRITNSIENDVKKAKEKVVRAISA